ncbi:UNVERIFIED_CONTAM: choline transporter-like family protein, partial [Bacteroidetes bacterium 56_B9]
MFERIFLSGHFTGAKKWVINANSWWLGAYFILQYLWSLGVIAGLQRATTAAVVSQWYFHRLAVPQPTSQEVVKASFL